MLPGLTPVGSNLPAEGEHGILGFPSTIVFPASTNLSGKVFFLNPSLATASDNNVGTNPQAPFATLAAAYAACTDGAGDTIVYVPGATSLTLTAALTWAKSYTHLIGVAAPTMVAQRARIFQSASLTGASPLIDVTGSGCIFQNLYIFQGVADATSLVNVRVTGSRNYFGNVHFAGGGHATQAIDGGASLLISGGSENLFEDCTIGVDTISAATGMAALVFAATGGAARNIFRRCHFTLQAGNAGVIWVEVLGNSGIDRYQIFDECLFVNLGTALTQGTAIAAGFDPANKRLLLRNCISIGAAKWDNADRGAVYGNMNAVTGADLSGAAVQLIT